MEAAGRSDFFLHRTGSLISSRQAEKDAETSTLVVYGLQQPTVGPILLGKYGEERTVAQGCAYFAPDVLTGADDTDDDTDDGGDDDDDPAASED
jgi:hypothetical protein